MENKHLEMGRMILQKKKHDASPGHDASTAEAAPCRADGVGFAEYAEEVSDREVHKVAQKYVRKAEERSQHTIPSTRYILPLVHIFIFLIPGPWYARMYDTIQAGCFQCTWYKNQL